MAGKVFIVYKLRGEDNSGELLEYTGIVEVYSWQTLKQAAGVRGAWHISHRLRCLEDLVPSSVVLDVLSPRCQLDDALALEAVHTVMAYSHDSRARGGAILSQAFAKATATGTQGLSGDM